jgi:zinc D-Ala-D-Ala carboxypeptidase
MNIGRHFTLAELTHSNTAQAEGISNNPGPAELVALRALCADVLDPLREALGKAITINCAYRSPALNRRVGGVANSQHISGQAADLQSPGATVLALFKLVISQGLPYDQVIYEARSATSKWLHVSHVGGVGANRGEIRVAQFGPDGKPQSYPLITKAAALAMVEPAARGRSAGLLDYVEGADEPAPAAPTSAKTPRSPAAQPRHKPAPAAKVVAKKSPAKKVPAKKPASAAGAKTATAKKKPRLQP